MNYKISTKPKNKLVMLISIILCFVLIFFGTVSTTPLVLDTDADTNTYWSDYATNFDPDTTTGKYYVYTPGQLAYIFLKLPKNGTINVELMADLDMSAHIWNSTTFSANLNFDGHVHNIINIKCNKASTCGLIKSATGKLHFKNTRLMVNFDLNLTVHEDLAFVGVNPLGLYEPEGFGDRLDEYLSDEYQINSGDGRITYRHAFVGENIGAFVCEKNTYSSSKDDCLIFENCSTHGNILVNGDVNSIGGFVGSINTPFYATNCFNNIAISNNSGVVLYSGGIVGKYTAIDSSSLPGGKSIITLCGNCGDISGNIRYVGGIVGCSRDFYMQQLRCYNCANIKTSLQLPTIEKKEVVEVIKYNHIVRYEYVLEVTGYAYGTAGGLVGCLDFNIDLYYQVISYAYNTGTITSNDIAGGIIGNYYLSSYYNGSYFETRGIRPVLYFSNIYSVGMVDVPYQNRFDASKSPESAKAYTGWEDPNPNERYWWDWDETSNFFGDYGKVLFDIEDSYSRYRGYFDVANDMSLVGGRGAEKNLNFDVGLTVDNNFINYNGDYAHNVYTTRQACYGDIEEIYNIGCKFIQYDPILQDYNTNNSKSINFTEYINCEITPENPNWCGIVYYGFENTSDIDLGVGYFDIEYSHKLNTPNQRCTIGSSLYRRTMEYFYTVLEPEEYKNNGFNNIRNFKFMIGEEKYEYPYKGDNSEHTFYKCLETNIYRFFVACNIWYYTNDTYVYNGLSLCPIYQIDVIYKDKQYTLYFTAEEERHLVYSYDLSLYLNSYYMYNELQDITADKFDGDVFVQNGDLPMFKDLVW